MLSDLKIRRFLAVLERRLNRYLAKSGLDILSLAVLTAATEQPRSEVDVATLLDVHPNTLVQLCRRLEQLNLITRQRDPTDKRRLLLVPTPTARSLVRKAKRTKLLALVFHPLSQEEIAQLHSLITKLLDSHKSLSPLD